MFLGITAYIISTEQVDILFQSVENTNFTYYVPLWKPVPSCNKLNVIFEKHIWQKQILLI